MEKWNVKEIIKIIIIVGLIMWVIGLILIIFYRNSNDEMILSIIELMSNDIDGNTSIEKGILNFSLIWLPTVFILPTIFLVITKTNYKAKEISNKELYREIEEKYTPAIASFVIDKTTEKNKDILATILDLNVRGYIKIERNQDFEMFIENKNTDNLYLHEKYIIDQIKENKHIYIYEFIEAVKEDCKNEGLLKERKAQKIDLIYILILITCIIIFLNTPVYTDSALKIKALAFIGGIFSFSMIKFKLLPYRTRKGKEVAIKFKGLKNYLKEYTLVKTRDIEYVNTLDRYLTFALALGEADYIEKIYVPYNKLISKYIRRKL